ELQDAFKDLFENFCFLQKEHNVLKNNFSKLKHENTSLFQEKKSLEEKLEDFSKEDFSSKIQALSLENDNLKNSISRFEKGKNVFYGNHKHLHISNGSNKRCFYRCRKGHIVTYCPFKKKKHTFSWKWVPKGTTHFCANPIGPKEIWIPRTRF